MMAFAFEEDPLCMGLYPMNHRVKETTFIMVLWFVLSLVFHLTWLIFRSSNWAEFWEDVNERVQLMIDTCSGGCCPYRKARFMKCARRCARRRRCGGLGSIPTDRAQVPQDSEANSNCPLEQAAHWLKEIQTHIPPPLPLRKRKKKDCPCSQKEAQIAVAKEESREEFDANHPAANSSKAIAITKPAPIVPRATLLDLARMQQWKALMEHVNRKEAKHCDVDGLYPLHWACSGGPPVEVIQALLESYPSACKKVDLEGSTPLHFATHYSASAAVVDTLLKVYPKAVRMQDKYGRTPLFHATEKSASLDVLMTLVKADPSMITTPCLPLTWRQNNKTTARITTTSTMATTTAVVSSRLLAVRTPLFLSWASVLSDRPTRLSCKGKKWDKAQFLLEAAYLYHHHPESWSLARLVPRCRLLPAALTLDMYMPEPVVNLILSMGPRQAQMADDLTGQLPLSLVSGTTQYSTARSLQLTQLLLEADPAAASRRDAGGRSALGQALVAGKSWQLIRPLLEAAPEALGWRDGPSGLYPALLAASALRQSARSEGQASQDPVQRQERQQEEEKQLLSLNQTDPYGLLSAKQAAWLQRRPWSLGEIQGPGITADGDSSSSDDPEAQEVGMIYDLLQANPAVWMKPATAATS